MGLVRLVRSVALVLLGVLFAGATPSEAVAASAMPTAIHAYDGHHDCSPSTDTLTERGPPGGGHAHITPASYRAVDPGSRGSLARPGASTRRVVTTYNGPSMLVQVVRTTGTTQRRGDVADGNSVVRERLRDAANAADDILRQSTRDTWGKLGTLDDHFLRHGGDFGATSADDYARQASEFFQRGIKDGLPTKNDPKTGVVRVFDPATNSFGAYNPTGTTRTFYKPDPAAHGYASNWDYWLAQPGYTP